MEEKLGIYKQQLILSITFLILSLMVMIFVFIKLTTPVEPKYTGKITVINGIPYAEVETSTKFQEDVRFGYMYVVPFCGLTVSVCCLSIKSLSKRIIILKKEMKKKLDIEKSS